MMGKTCILMATNINSTMHKSNHRVYLISNPFIIWKCHLHILKILNTIPRRTFKQTLAWYAEQTMAVVTTTKTNTKSTKNLEDVNTYNNNNLTSTLSSVETTETMPRTSTQTQSTLSAENQLSAVAKWVLSLSWCFPLESISWTKVTPAATSKK
jgi:hypothetical protein